MGFRRYSASALLGAVVGTGALLAAQVVLSVPIDYGDCILDSLTPAGDADTLTFSATSGDVVIVRMARVSGDIAVRIQVYDTGWSILADEWGFAYTAVDTLLLSGTGQHAIVASDYTGFGTGPYRLSLQRTFGPGGASSLNYGTTVLDSVTLLTEMNAYTFAADSRDIVTARMSWSQGSLQPYLRLFDPSGRQLAEDFSYPKPMLDTVFLEDTGDYTLIACDQYGSWLGGYGFSLQRTFDPLGADTIDYHQTIEDTISQVSQLKAYVFDGMGYYAVIAMTKLTGTLTPYLELYTPSGQKLAEDWGMGQAGFSGWLGSGWYTLLASDHTGPDTGIFTLMLSEVGVEEENRDITLPGGPALLPCSPNPFAGQTIVRYILPDGVNATVRVSDVAGRMMCVLASGWHNAGEYTLTWDGTDSRGGRVSNGIYLLTLESGELSHAGRVTFIR